MNSFSDGVQMHNAPGADLHARSWRVAAEAELGLGEIRLDVSDAAKRAQIASTPWVAGGAAGSADAASPAAVVAVTAHYSARPARAARSWAASPIGGLKTLNNWVKAVLLAQALARVAASPNHADSARSLRVLDVCCGQGGDLLKFLAAGRRSNAGRGANADRGANAGRGANADRGANAGASAPRVEYYVGLDIAGASVRAAAARYNALLAGTPDAFAARFCVVDCHVPMQTDGVWLSPDRFHLASCQFALHYSFATAERARGLVETISARLLPGACFVCTLPDAQELVRRALASASASTPTAASDAGAVRFGNALYAVTIEPGMVARMAAATKISESLQPRIADRPCHRIADRQAACVGSEMFGLAYHFALRDAVDCVEWLVPRATLVALCAERDLELVAWQSLASVADAHGAAGSEFSALPHRAAARPGSIYAAASADERAVAELYCAATFQRRLARPGGRPPAHAALPPTPRAAEVDPAAVS